MNGLRKARAWSSLLWATTLISANVAEAQSQPPQTNAAAEVALTLEPPKTNLWQHGVGEGFQPGASSFSLLAGAGLGVAILGSQQAHDLALLSLSYGHMLGRVRGEGHCFRGNFEGRLEFFSGAEFSPSTEWVIGLTPHLRYNFATGTRWIPFLDAGAGVAGTSIGPPDLSNTFEFNLQAGSGVHWFVKDDLALTVEGRYFHMSCAGISHPNLGVNTVMGLVGLTWFF